MQRTIKILVASLLIFIPAAYYQNRPTITPFNRPWTANTNVFEQSKINPHDVRAITYNIRGDFLADRMFGNSWHKRKFLIKTIINFYQPDLIGLQEVNKSYIADLEELFPNYGIVAYDADPIFKDAALLVAKDRFTILDQNFFWLSQNPDTLAYPAWDSNATHVAVYALLHDNVTNKKCYVLVTHLDSHGTVARTKSAQLIAHKINAIAENDPAIVMGDFNFMKEPSKKGQQAYTLLGQSAYLTDVRDLSKHHFGPDGTWIGWSYNSAAVKPGTVGSRLDNIFVHNFKVVRDGVLDIKVKDHTIISAADSDFLSTAYPSDHLPIIADLAYLQ